MDEYEIDSGGNQGLLPDDWITEGWKEVAKYYRDLWLTTIDDLVESEDAISILHEILKGDTE